MLNLNSQTLDELAARIGKAFENSPAKDLEKNVKAMLACGLARLDVVPRAEFDIAGARCCANARESSSSSKRASPSSRRAARGSCRRRLG